MVQNLLDYEFLGVLLRHSNGIRALGVVVKRPEVVDVYHHHLIIADSGVEKDCCQMSENFLVGTFNDNILPVEYAVDNQRIVEGCPSIGVNC